LGSDLSRSASRSTIVLTSGSSLLSAVSGVATISRETELA
jgi:hypothetical protein